MENVSNAERYSHLNDVEKASAAKYGTAEKQSEQAYVTHDRSSFASSISSSAEKGMVTSSSVEKNVKAGLLSIVATTAVREIEGTIAKNNINDNLGERTSAQAKKFGYKIGKYAGKGLYVAGRGSLRYGKKAAQIFKDGVPKSAAVKAFAEDIKNSAINSGNGAESIIKNGTIHFVEDFKGSDDLGIEAVVKSKDFVFKTSRSFKVAKGTFSSVKKGAAQLKNITEKAVEAGRKTVAAARKVATNPVVLQGIGVMVLLAIICSAVGAVASSFGSIFSIFSLKSEDWEVTQAYEYITKLDTEMLFEILNEENSWHIPSIDEYRYYMNGVQVSKEQMSVYTNADLILAYLDSKYDSYSFSGIIAGLFGTTVKGELKDIHKQLHQWNTSTGTFDVLHITTSGGVTTEWTETVR